MRRKREGRGAICPARLMLISSLFLMAGCNTFSGVGRDITGSAEYLQVYMPPEFQNPPVGGTASQAPAQASGYSAPPGMTYGNGAGVPPLGAV